jgi:hypothetical protein
MKSGANRANGLQLILKTPYKRVFGRWCCVFAVAFSFFSTRSTQAQEMIFGRYDVGNGLFSDYVFDIEQDAVGYLWVATDQ